MATCTGRYRNKAVCAFAHRALSETVVDDVVKHDATPAVNLIIHPLLCTKGSNDDGHFVLLAHVHIVLKTGVRAVNNLVNRKRRGFIVRVVLVVILEF